MKLSLLALIRYMTLAAVTMACLSACPFHSEPNVLIIHSIMDAKRKLADYTFMGYSPNEAVDLIVRMNFGDLSQPDNKYLELLEVIGDRGLYVELSLSGSKMSKTTVFTSPPLNKAAKGMDKIVNMSFPINTTSIEADKNGRSPFFFYENLVRVYFAGAKIVNIGDYAFSSCKNLEGVETNSAKTIGREAFLGCENMNYFSFYNVETIGDKAFFDCTALECLFMYRLKPPKLGDSVFLGTTPGTFTISVEEKYEELYRAWLLENATCFNNNGEDIVIEARSY